MNRLIQLIMFAVVCIFLPGTLSNAREATPDAAVDSLFPQPSVKTQSKIDLGTSDHKPSSSADSLKIFSKRLDNVESRLGAATRQQAPTTTIERRLIDAEQRLDRLEQQYNRMQQLEQRIRKIETQRY